MRNPIAQEDPNGCGVACAAFVLGKSYQETRQLFNSKKLVFGVHSPTLVKVLQSQNLNYKRRKINAGNIHLTEVNNAIIYVAPSQQYNTGHWLVRYRGKYMNSWVNCDESCDIANAKAAFCSELPGEPQWVVFPVD